MTKSDWNAYFPFGCYGTGLPHMDFTHNAPFSLTTVSVGSEMSHDNIDVKHQVCGVPSFYITKEKLGWNPRERVW